jgi:hypothetical protein
MFDLGTKIRRHYEDTTPSIDISALVDRMETSPARPRPPVHRGLAVAFVAALLVLIVVAVPFLLNNQSGAPVIGPSLPSPITVAPPPSETTIPTPTTTAAPPTTNVRSAPVSEFPPFHIATSSPTGTSETWYLDEDTIRQTVIEATEADRVGTFSLVADGYSSVCSTDQRVCRRRDIAGSSVRAFWLWAPVALVEETCTEGVMDTIAGRSARHFVCDGVTFVHEDGDPRQGDGDHWVARDDSGRRELWFDSATDIRVKILLSDGYFEEATLLEIDPVFPSSIFEYEEMVFP